MADSRETGREFEGVEVEGICEISMGSNVPASFEIAAGSVFIGTMVAVSKDHPLLFKVWREVAYRIFEREFGSEDEAHYALLYGTIMAFGKQLYARRVGARFEGIDLDELEKKVPEESVLLQKLEETLQALDMLHEGVISRSTVLRRVLDRFKNPSPFFLHRTTEFVEEYFSDSRKQARIKFLAFSA